MEKIQKIILIVLSGLLAGIIITCIVISSNKQKSIDTFTPPSFDKHAVSGVPDDVPAYAKYKELTIKERFKIAMASSLKIEDGNAKVFFTSDEMNVVMFKIVLQTEGGQSIGESGLLKPGEYVENVAVNEFSGNSKEIIVKILSYEPKTYYSQGTATIKVPLVKQE